MQRFNLRSSAEALADLPEIPKIVEGFLDEGTVAILAGDAGSGKTYFILEMAVCVATGRLFLGNLPTYQSKVLFIDEESGDRRLLRRLRRIFNAKGIKSPIDLDFLSLSGIDLFNRHQTTKSDFHELNDLIHNNGYKLVLIDALMDIVPGADENAVKDIQPVLQKLRVIAEGNKCTILVLHHTNKSGLYRGSSAIKGSPDNLFVITKTGKNLSIKSDKARDSEDIEINAKIEFTNDAVYLVSAVPLNFGPAEIEAIKYLAINGESSSTDIANSAKQSKPDSIKNALTRLCTKGICEQTRPGGQGKTGWYELKKDGYLYALDKGWLLNPWVEAFLSGERLSTSTSIPDEI